MWLVTEFRRGPSATSFFSLAPDTLFFWSFLFFLSAHVFLGLSDPIARMGLGLNPPGLSVLGGTALGPTGSSCAAQLFGAPGTKLLARPSQTSLDLSFASSFISRRLQERNGCSVGLGVARVGTWDPERVRVRLWAVCAGKCSWKENACSRLRGHQFASVSAPYPGARHRDTLQTGAPGVGEDGGSCPTEGGRAGHLVGRGVEGGGTSLGLGLLEG